MNKSRHDIVAEVQPNTITPPNHVEKDTLPLFGGTSLNISRNNVSIHDAEQEAARMIKAAKALGLNKINITIEK
ncbi:hypothetical protein [Halobacillus sp. B23F22_1]|uniref:hypothetical protein n=1 Tax=Halobacillus sp. B23F22_1 TaxID=3459514 RepID=UPI00373E9C08